MKILCLVHLYCPIHNAGGETTLHAAMRAMVVRGHDVTVVCRPQCEEEGAKFESYEYEGVKVLKCPIRGDQEFVRRFIPTIDPDLMITHLDLTTLAMQTAVELKKPLAHWLHNTMSVPVFGIIPAKCQLAIFNSHWVAEYHKWHDKCCADPECAKCGGSGIAPRPQIVIHPTVEPERYRCERGTKIALVNPTPGKGADTFYALSKLMPDAEFLCVKSVYGEQIAVPNISAHLHPNVETMEHTPDIREAFAKTKVLLMPSEYESYGRVAVEGACAGIPTIAHPTPGLLESLSLDVPQWLSKYAAERMHSPKVATPEQLKGGFICGAGIFCDRADVQSWETQLRKLLSDSNYYQERSDAALALADSLEPEAEFDRLEKALLITSETWKRRNGTMALWKTDKRLYRWPDGTIHDTIKDGCALFLPIGGELPLAEAERLGLVSPPAVTSAPALDTRAEAKMVAGPAENKADDKLKRKKAA